MNLRSSKLISLFVILGGSCFSHVTPTIEHTADRASYTLSWEDYKLENLGIEILVGSSTFPVGSKFESEGLHREHEREHRGHGYNE